MIAGDILLALKEGEVLELGALMPGLTKEKVTWTLLESAELEKGRRLTFHLHWLGIFLKPMVLMIAPDGKITSKESKNG